MAGGEHQVTRLRRATGRSREGYSRRGASLEAPGAQRSAAGGGAAGLRAPVAAPWGFSGLGVGERRRSAPVGFFI